MHGIGGPFVKIRDSQPKLCIHFELEFRSSFSSKIGLQLLILFCDSKMLAALSTNLLVKKVSRLVFPRNRKLKWFCQFFFVFVHLSFCKICQIKRPFIIEKRKLLRRGYPELWLPWSRVQVSLIVDFVHHFKQRRYPWYCNVQFSPQSRLGQNSSTRSLLMEWRV